MKAPDETQPLYRLAHRRHAHTQTNAHQGLHHPPTPLKLESTLLAHAHIGSSRCVSGDIIFATNQLTPNTWLFYHMWLPACIKKKKDTHAVLFPSSPPPPLLLTISIATSLRQHLHASYHLMTLFPLCALSLCNEVSE